MRKHYKKGYCKRGSCDSSSWSSKSWSSKSGSSKSWSSKSYSSDSCSSSKSGSSSSSCYSNKRKFCKLLEYVRIRMLNDKDLMPCGAGAFAEVISKNPQIIAKGAAMTFDFNGKMLNVEHIPGTSQIVVRKSGLYGVVVTISTEEPAQFAIFVNGEVIESTVTGVNSGANQLVIRNHLLLKKDDVITVKNFTSVVAVNLNTGAGGETDSVESTVAELTLIKFATYPNYKLDCDISKRWPKHKHIYDKILCKLECDKSFVLDPKFPAYGSFYRVNSQVLPVEAPIIFERHAYVKNLSFTDGDSEIVIDSNGVYWIILTVGTDKATQLTLFVNDNPMEDSRTGIDSGAAQLVTRQILELNAGDRLSVRNHVSANGDITVTQNGGGTLPGINAALLIFKENPLLRDLDSAAFFNPRNKYLSKCGKWDHFYHQFKKYLVSRNILVGNTSYLSAFNVVAQTIQLEKDLILYQNKYYRNIKHLQGKSEIIVEEDGIYVVTVDIYTNTPAQFTIYVNDIPDHTTTSGTDSGAGLATSAQLIKLKKCDRVKVVNHSSAVGSVTLTENAGGTEIATNTNFFISKVDSIKNYYCNNKMAKSYQ